MARLAGELVVVDTSVFSYIWKKDSRAAPYLERLEGSIPALSFQTVGEVMYGAHKRKYIERTFNELRSEIRKYYVVPFNQEIAEEWGKIMAERDAVGNSLEWRDAWIAATARWLKVPVMTHNRRHFEATEGLEVITFAPPRSPTVDL
jgi:predicted nucleic acid-binding protein